MTSEITNQNTNQNTGENGGEDEKLVTTPEQPAEADGKAPAKPTEPAANIPEGKESPEVAPENAEKDAEKLGLVKRLEELEAALLKEQIKVLLLIAGVLPEKLEDGAAMAYGLCLAGKTPENAAGEIAAAYPHLKAVRTELPQFSAESAGSKDGFSAIRRIFSTR